MRWREFLAATAAVSLSLLAQQQTGTLVGRVVDAATGAPLRSVTVRLVGTTYGAVTAPNGQFVLRYLPPGTYVLEATLIGYKALRQSGIRIRPGDTVELLLRLEETALTLGQEIVVLGERPLIDVEQTQSLRVISQQQLERSAVQTVTEALIQQSGVLLQDNTLHIRGGRGYELAYLVDGISVQDPLAGSGFGVELSPETVQEIELLTSGFAAEYGQATSGVLNLRTAEPSRSLRLRLQYRPEWRIHRRNPYDRDTGSLYQTDRYSLSFSGPEPITRHLLPALGLRPPGQLGVVATVEGASSDGLVPEFARIRLRSSLLPAWLARRQDNSLSTFLKLSWQLSPAIRLSYVNAQSMALNQNTRTLQTTLEYLPPEPGYQYQFQGHFDGALTFSALQRLHVLTWQQSLGPRLLYELRLGYAGWRVRADANGRDYTRYSEPQDIPTLPPQYYDTGDSTRTGIIPGDGFYDIGTAWSWRDHFAYELTLKADLTAFLAEKSQIKTGAELRLQELQYCEIFAPWIPPLGLNNDAFSVRPRLLTLYAQHHLTQKGLVLHYGLRAEAWAPGRLVDEAIDNPALSTITEERRRSYRAHTVPAFGLRWKLRLQPRLGIAHPITPTQMLYFNYGHFTKLPRPQYIYAKLSPAAARSSYQRFGNPDLNPETSIAYELGLRNQLTTDDVLSIALFYRDIFGYVQTRPVRTDNPRFAGGRFITYVNADYARARGVEVEYRKRIGRWLELSAMLGYSSVTGKSSSADQGLLIARGLIPDRLTEDPMPWDRPWDFQLNLWVQSPEGSPPLGLSILEGWRLWTRFVLRSGRRYTPAVPVIDPTTGTQRRLPNGRPLYELDEERPYSALAQTYRWWELALSRDLRIALATLRLRVEVLNPLDWKNPAIVNPVTGRAYEYGDPTPPTWNDPLYPDLQPPLEPYPFNPARYEQRRSLRIGMELIWE
ncbi:MAG: TonB-dependent receptor [Candidatus Kapabacteria bacterium]|nr:TonB-dependent receptor [Candidatus Kapabacteria bacterium]MDW8012005.1 TonB-dependent receptor [Bacteroidota bacterium]